MTEKILILDFGSQYTQLIARAVREARVYCEIIPYHARIDYSGIKGIILSGSPASVNQEDAPEVNVQAIADKVPVLGICYGAQLTAKSMGGLVEKSDKREYGRAHLHIKESDALFHEIPADSQVWMSHSDSITKLPDGFELLATTQSIPVAAFKKTTDDGQVSTVNGQLSSVNSQLSSVNSHLFNGLPETFEVGRYHSWIVSDENFPEALEVTARDDNGYIMALQHKTYDLQGVQFHPESVLTPLGENIIRNWLL